MSPKVPGYPYPYPDFFQLCYVAEADQHYPDKQVLEKYVLETFMASVADARQLKMHDSQKLLLDAAHQLVAKSKP